jgi:antitoxin HicB
MKEKKMKKSKNLEYYNSLHYAIEIIPFDTEDDGLMYEACIPQLGRYAFSGIGESADKAIESLNTLKSELFAEMIEEGREIPEPEDPEEEFSGRFVLRVDKGLHKELVIAARDKNISLNKHVNDILTNWKQSSYLENLVHESVKIGIKKALFDLAIDQRSEWRSGQNDVEEPPVSEQIQSEECSTDDILESKDHLLAA